MKIKLTQESCGFGMPRYQFIEQRQTLIDCLDKKGENSLREYQQENNSQSIDHKPTGLKF